MASYSTNISGVTREYRIAAFWRYFACFFLLGFIGLMGYLGYDILTDAKNNIPAFVVIPVAIFLIYGCIYLIIRAFKEKLIIEADKFTHIKVYSNQIIYFDETKGFKDDQKYIYIIPNRTDIKIINITTYIARSEELLEYLRDNFTNLDQVEFEEQLDEILSDNNLGFTEQERAQKLKQAKLFSRFINWPGCIVFGLLIFYPTPYKLLVTLGVLFPLLAIAALKSNKLIRFDEEKNSPYPNIALGFFMPFCGVALRLLLDLSIADFENLWLPSGAVFILLIIVLIMGNNAFNFSSGKKIASSVLIMMMIYAYCYTATVMVNCIYDSSEPTEYKVKVIDKKISRGKTTTYNLVLEKWGAQNEAEQERVNSDMYNRTEIGQKVTVNARPGILGAQWYTVSE